MIPVNGRCKEMLFPMTKGMGLLRMRGFKQRLRPTRVPSMLTSIKHYTHPRVTAKCWRYKESNKYRKPADCGEEKSVYDFFITPVYNSDKKITGGIIIMHDVTDRVELDQHKTEFISLASHQLRTPLSTVNWYTEMLLTDDAGKLNDEQKKYLDEVYIGNQRMVALVNALLNVSRLELGIFMVEPEPTDIVKLAQSVTDEQRTHIEVKKIKFSKKYADHLPLLNADPKLLQMVFQNLLSNAIKYTPRRWQHRDRACSIRCPRPSVKCQMFSSRFQTPATASRKPSKISYSPSSSGRIMCKKKIPKEQDSVFILSKPLLNILAEGFGLSPPPPLKFRRARKKTQGQHFMLSCPLRG